MEVSKLQPLHDFVVVERIAPPEKIGLIYLPDERLEQSYWVKVLAVGPGRLLPSGHRTKMNAKVGATMFCRQYEGFRLQPEKEWRSPLIVQDISLEVMDVG